MLNEGMVNSHYYTIPLIPDNNIERPHLIRQLKNMFSLRRTAILVEGIPNSGKTQLLAQFVRSYPDQSFFYFFSDNYLTTNSTSFLIDICEQLNNVLKISKKKTDICSLDESDLKQLLIRLYSRLKKQAPIHGPYYFVIDGLDLVNDEELLKLIPAGDRAGIYILLSSNEDGRKYPIDYEPIIIQEFSEDDSIKFFKGTLLQDEEIKTIHKSCDGMPGYLTEIRRQVECGITSDELMRDLPSGFETLLHKEWDRLNLNNQIELLLSVLVFGPEHYCIEDLSEILDIDRKTLWSMINKISFIKVNKDNIVTIINVYKNFIQKKINHKRQEAFQHLIHFYQSSIDMDKPIRYLPELYKERQDFTALKTILSVDNILDYFKSTGQISLLRKNLKVLGEVSKDNDDWQNLIFAGLMDSIFSDIVISPSLLKDEVEALLALNKINDAINLSLACSLPDGRLVLLARLCNFMKTKEMTIDRTLLESIDDSIEQMDIDVEMSEEYIKKIMDICSGLLPVQPKSVSRIFDKIVENSNIPIPKGRLMDLLLMMLIKKLGPKSECAEDIKNKINNDSYIDFLYEGSATFQIMTTQELLTKVDQIDDTSTKIYFVRSWCSRNYNNNDGYTVVEKALNIILEAEDYVPTMYHLRQIALPLINCPDEDIALNLIAKVDLLIDTALPNPKDEKAWLELILASVENKWNNDNGVTRLYGIYFSLEDEKDQDLRCSILTRILVNIDKIAPSDLQLKNDITQQLKDEYDNLLKNSADQLTIVRKLIKILPEYDLELSLNFVRKLNSEKRRNVGFSLVALQISYGTNVIQHISEMIKVKNEITDKDFRDWVYVKSLDKLVKSKPNLKEKDNLKVKTEISDIDSPTGKALAFAYLFNITEEYDTELLPLIEENLFKIDAIDQRISIGYKIVTLVCEKDHNFADRIFLTLQESRITHPLADLRIMNMYGQTCILAHRMIPAFSKSLKYLGYIDMLKTAILLIPSTIAKCSLLADLSLRCLLLDHRDSFNEITNICLSLLEKQENPDIIKSCIVNMAAMLFEHERELLFEKLHILGREDNDLACIIIIEYLITKRPPLDNFDIKQSVKKIEYSDALKIIAIIKAMNQDAYIYNAMKWLVDHIVKKGPNNRIEASLNEKQLLNISKELAQIIKAKLPDQNNILHDGYLIACYTCIAKLRDASKVGHYRAVDQWAFVPSWDEIQSKINSLTNYADKVLVYQIAAVTSYDTNNQDHLNFIKHAESNLKLINNHVDRANKYSIVAEGYERISLKEAAKFYIDETIKLAQVCSTEEGRDEILGSTIELAHSIDSDYASALTNSIENKLTQIKLQQGVFALDCHNDPRKINEATREIKSVAHDVFKRMIKSLNAGRGTIQHAEVIGNWIFKSFGLDFSTLHSCTDWYIQNTLASNQLRNNSENELKDLMDGMINLLRFIYALSYKLSLSDKDNTSSLYSIMSSNIMTFTAEEGSKALDFIGSWILENTITYIKIYDPYFQPNDLSILKYISTECNVSIITSGKLSGLSNIKEQFKNAWQKTCDQIPPDTLVYVLASKSGKTTMHDRYILSDYNGLELGTSLNGWGHRDSTIIILDTDEKSIIERELVDPTISTPPNALGNEKIITKRFDLS